MNPAQGFVRLSLRDLLLLDELAERPANPFHPSVDVLRLDGPQSDVVAVEGGQLRASVAHLPRPDDRDPQSAPLHPVDGPDGIKDVVRHLRRKRLCAASVMENWDRRGPLARSGHRRRDDRGGYLAVPHPTSTPPTQRTTSSEGLPPS